MDGAGDIVAVSIPFTSGMAVAAFLLPGGGETMVPAAACYGAAMILLCFSAGMRNMQRTILAAVFFLSGMGGFISAATAVTPGNASHALSDSLAVFTAFLDSIDFGHHSTGALVKALLTGVREGMDRSIVNSFRASGASHILALSGLHLGVIYGILKRTLSILGNSRTAAAVRSVCIIAASFYYTVLTGAGPSIVRAFLFILIREISGLFAGRRRSRINVFFSALTVQLCLDPLAITSVGFQLSYMAMLGIILVFPKLEAWYPESGRHDILRIVWKSAAMSFSCQLFTAPLVWHHFHSFPVYFLLTNLIALPLTEALIVSAVVTVSLSAVGCCPEFIKGLTDFLGQTLISCLEIIGSL